MLYSLLLALSFGILEGITEWLPISSTGHIILLGHFLPIPFRAEFFELFEVVIQLGAMCAVLVLFFHTLCPFFGKNGGLEHRRTWALWGKILIAALPSAIIGLWLDDPISELLFNPQTVAICLLAYGILFLMIERHKRTARICDIHEIRTADAIKIGFFQVLALIPGTSRSGATILGGLLLGVSRPVSALFSFFLGFPTMLGAGALKIFKFFLSGTQLTGPEALALTVGTLTAFLISLATLGFLTDFVRQHTFSAFGIYRILLGLAVLLTFFV